MSNTAEIAMTRSLFGVYEVQISPLDLLAIESVLRQHRLPIVELGTGYGVTSLYLGMAARLAQKQMWTFDCVDRRIEPVKKAWLPNMTFTQADVLAGAPVAEVKVLLSQPVLLFCDDGQKPAEFRAYAPCLLPGSVVMVHDWTREIGPGDVDATVRECELEPVERGNHSLIAAWRKP
jgi:trans-aconitate methyltransferase